MKFSYKTVNVCPTNIDIIIEDNKIKDVEFIGGGCLGNQAALRRVLTGMEIDKVIDLFEGLECAKRGQGSSCADQLVKAIEQSLEVSR